MRKPLALMLAGLMAVSMVGCGSNGDAASSSDNKDKADSGKVTLKVTTTYAGEDTNAGNYKDACAAWTKETGNKIEDSSATSDETFKSRVITDFETGSEPDVLFFFNGVDSNQFVEQGKVVSIDEIRQEYPDYASNMKDDMLGASPVDGKNYSVPVNGYWEGLFVNKDVLKEAGVEAPTADTTWDEFMTMCETIKKAGYTPIAASLQEIPHYWFEYTIFNFQDVATHNTLPKSADDEYGKAWVNGINDIKDLYEKGYFPDNTLTASDSETFELFTSDKAAFLIDGSWKVGGIEEAVDDIDNYTVTYVPGKGNRKSTDLIGGLSSGYYITKKCWDDPEKRAAAVDFIKYMTSDEMVSKFAGSSATALKNGATVDADSMSSLANAGVELCAGATGISPAVQDSLSTAAKDPIFAGMADIVQGNTKVAAAVDEALTINSGE